MEYFTPVQNLLAQADNNPNRVFLHQPVNRQWQEFTWADVEHQSRSIAAGLREQGFEQGSKIGILSKNCAQWVITDLAIMMAGMISVPIYPTANQTTIDYIIKHTGLKAVFVGKLDEQEEAEQAITDDVLSIAFPYPTIKTKTTFDTWLKQYPPLVDIHQPAIDDVATIVYTSGSTGIPKGVVLTHKNWASAAQHTAASFNVSASDRVISYLPLAHIVERSLAAVSLSAGYQVFFSESVDTFIDDLQFAKPTLFGSVPRLWTIFQSKVLTKISQRKLNILLPIPIIGGLVSNKIRTGLGLQHCARFVSGTAPIPSALLHWYDKLNMPISEAWGMTETSSMSCINMPYLKQNISTIGKPIPCVEMKLSGEGEILIRGEAVFTEYYLNPEATNESFVNGWFRTGDCAEINANGAYKIIGRIKDKFKTSKGKYVAPVPLESALSVNTDIEQVCVVGSGLKQPVALIVINESLNRKSSEVNTNLQHTLQSINSQLESHEKIDCLLVCKDSWSIANELLTPTMKIKRNVIESKYTQLIPDSIANFIIWEEDLIQHLNSE